MSRVGMFAMTACGGGPMMASAPTEDNHSHNNRKAVGCIYATDFEYDGKRLSEFGFIVCSFDAGNGARAAAKGSEVTFHTAPIGLGQRFAVTGSKYEARLSTSFQICKDPDKYDNNEMNITSEEFRELSRWLNRREFLWFRAYDDCEPNLVLPWFRASFSLQKVDAAGATVGVQLNMQTDSPFGYGDVVEESFSFTPGGMTKIIEDKNDEVGVTWPEVVITCRDNGELKLVNELTGCCFRVRNCMDGEKITQYGDAKIISAEREIRNLLLFPGSKDYKAGGSTVIDGLRYSVGDDGTITIGRA